MELIITLAMKFWMWTLLIALIIIGFIINLFDKKVDTRVNFKYSQFPTMRPIPIKTKGKGFFTMIKMWLLGTRHWEIANDFEYEVNGEKFVIPAGFKFDGASIPKFLHPFLSANSLYSMSSSTKVSECSETKAIGTKTICFSNFEFSTITSSVDGPIHFNGPTRL